MIKEETLLFNAADRDQDGKLTEAEYAAFDRPEQYDYMQPLVIQRTKESRDKNGDGFVDFHEYIVDIVPNYKSRNSYLLIIGLIAWLIGWLIDWVTDCSIHWLIDWLICFVLFYWFDPRPNRRG